MALWTPSDLAAGIVLRWWDANDGATITQSGGAVSQWNDKSSNGAHATQGLGANQPTYSATGFPGGAMPAISFDGSDDYFAFTATGWDGTDGRSVVCAVQRDTATLTRTIISGPQDHIQFRIETTHNLGLVRTFFAFLGGGATTLSSGGHVVGMDATSSAFELWADGTSDLTGGAPSFTGGFSNIGRNAAGGNEVFSGAIGEIVVTKKLSTTDRRNLEGYLAWKWGTQSLLPGGHPYAGAAPTTGGGSLILPPLRPFIHLLVR